ncbi:MAG: hypothetical protein ABW034_03145 [Steroidobacteraceae bacterium]
MASNQPAFDDADQLGEFQGSKAFDKLRRTGIADARALVSRFRERTEEGVWPSLNRAEVAHRLLALIGPESSDQMDARDEAGRAIQQGSMNLCGPAAFFQL